jgi:hypothetical protein
MEVKKTEIEERKDALQLKLLKLLVYINKEKINENN